MRLAFIIDKVGKTFKKGSNLYSIVSSNFQGKHLKQLRDWFVKEWTEVDNFEDTKSGLIIPAPLLVIENQKLLGGLAFTRFEVSGNLELWINALLVAPECRGLGIGSELINAAVVEAKHLSIHELFVYTHIPKLYQKAGWLNVSDHGEHKVLKIIIAIE